MEIKGRLSLKRVRWLYTYSGPRRWTAGAKDLGWIALRLACTEGDGRLQDGQFEMVDTKYRSYTHRLYDKDDGLYVIGDCRNYPVAYPLYRVTIGAESEAA